jgi:hypothetical protein
MYMSDRHRSSTCASEALRVPTVPRLCFSAVPNPRRCGSPSLRLHPAYTTSLAGKADSVVAPARSPLDP